MTDPAVPYGRLVRSRTASEWRTLLRVVAGIWIVNGIPGIPAFALGRAEMPHAGWFLANALVAFAFGFALLASAAILPDAVIDSLVEPSALAIFGFGVVAIAFSMYCGGVHFSAPNLIAYDVVAILAFYLLRKWVAVGVCLLAVACYGLVLVTFRTHGGEWVALGYMAVSMLVAGFLTGRLIDLIDRERAAKEAARAELAELNRNLESRVAEQVGEVERLGRMRRFLSAPVADAVLATDDSAALEPHRREIAVLFCDLRGFTAFTKQVEPEEVIDVLGEYYAAAGVEITRFAATMGAYEGDGLMAYLNDPVPCEDPAGRAIDLAVAIASAIDPLLERWQRNGYELSYGMGLAFGHATLGVVGFEGRSDYTALGSVVNLAARLCSTAAGREIVIDHRTLVAADAAHIAEERDPAILKGFADPVRNYLIKRS